MLDPPFAACIVITNHCIMATAREDLQLPFTTCGQKEREKLLCYIEEGQVGFDATLQGPFGTRKGTYVHTSNWVSTTHALCRFFFLLFLMQHLTASFYKITSLFNHYTSLFTFSSLRRLHSIRKVSYQLIISNY